MAKEGWVIEKGGLLIGPHRLAWQGGNILLPSRVNEICLKEHFVPAERDAPLRKHSSLFGGESLIRPVSGDSGLGPPIAEGQRFLEGGEPRGGDYLDLRHRP